MVWLSDPRPIASSSPEYMRTDGEVDQLNTTRDPAAQLAAHDIQPREVVGRSSWMLVSVALTTLILAFPECGVAREKMLTGAVEGLTHIWVPA